MVQSEKINEKLIRHYSDEGLHLRQVETDTVYGTEVFDEIPCRYSYEEITDEEYEERLKNRRIR